MTSGKPRRSGAASAPSLLGLRDLTKRFGPVVACDRISLDFAPGEIHGLLGENGAGKTTLMKVVAGVTAPDDGAITFDGARARWKDPHTARASGIGMVHQHLSLIGSMPVWRNVILGNRQRVPAREALRRIHALGEQFGLDVTPDALVNDLPAGQRQRVEILKCLWWDPRVLILDEPTALLTPQETEQLWAVLRRLVTDADRLIILISHRLEEVMRVTDRVTILRHGRVVETVRTQDSSPATLATAMLGRQLKTEREPIAVGAGATAALSQRAAAAATGHAGGDPVLEIRDLRVRGREGHHEIDGLDLTVRRGEVVGLAGVEGNGQEVLAEMFCHLASAESGEVLVSGSSFGSRRRYDGPPVGVIPVDRHDAGCILSMSVAENLILGCLDEVSRRGVIDQGLVRERADRLISEFGIKAANPDVPMWTLSGGNQQRVVLARELSRNPALLVAAQPTRGLDVGAMHYTWDLITSTANRGAGVLLISTDLDEVLALADRIAVIYRGKIIGEIDRAVLDIDRLGRLMGGQAA